jgi:microcystin degradation protein MlrC
MVSTGFRLVIGSWKIIEIFTQALGTEIFTEVGMDIASKRYVGVKSTNHFYAAFGPIAAKVLYCDGEGLSPVDPRAYPFRKILRPLWPHDDLPDGRMVV